MIINDFKTLTVNTDNRTWFYNTGCQYPLVCPKGTQVEFIKKVVNYYGIWYEVRYQNEIRYISPHLVDGNVIENIESYYSFDVATLTRKKWYILIDRYGTRYIVQNSIDGEMEKLERKYLKL